MHQRHALPMHGPASPSSQTPIRPPPDLYPFELHDTAAKHIPLSPPKPFYFHCSINALFIVTRPQMLYRVDMLSHSVMGKKDFPNS